MATSNDAPKIAYYDDACMLATWRSIAMPVIGSGIISAQGARLQARALEAHGKLMGKGHLGEVTIIAYDAPLPGAEARAQYDAAVPLIAPYYGCVSAIFEGTGFRAALVRGFLLSFQVLSRAKHPSKVCSTVDESALFMHRHAAAMNLEVTGPEEIAAALSAVRAVAIERKIFSAAASAATSAPQAVEAP